MVTFWEYHRCMSGVECFLADDALNFFERFKEGVRVTIIVGWWYGVHGERLRASWVDFEGVSCLSVVE
jgi:hypothetical protein